MGLWRRLPGWATRLAHVVYGFLVAAAAGMGYGLVAVLMVAAFTVYEFGEWLHDAVIYRRPSRWDFPDDEFAELGAGMALWMLLRVLGLL